MTPVVLPWANEGALCGICYAIWPDDSYAERCRHAPGAGRLLPPPGDSRRVLRIRYGDIAMAVSMALLWSAAAAFLLFIGCIT